MSDEIEKIREINRTELLEQWPRSDDGAMCARLLKRFVFTLLVETAAGANALPSSAQAESAGNKMLAMLVKDFGKLEVPVAPKPKRAPMAPLHRFQPDPKDKPTENP
jgi:hypothetical protein